jgi:hypothetical protein
MLLDIAGRKVLELHPGPNSTAGLAPGVYFLDDDLDARVVKMILVKQDIEP